MNRVSLWSGRVGTFYNKITVNNNSGKRPEEERMEGKYEETCYGRTEKKCFD